MLQRSRTASRSLRHCSNTKKSSIRETDQNNSIHPLRKNINIVTMPTCNVLLRHFRKRSYTHKDTRLHTRIFYVLLVTLRTTCLVQTAAVVTHALYHREGKKDSEGVGETNWVHKCTPSNHLSLAPSVTNARADQGQTERSRDQKLF